MRPPLQQFLDDGGQLIANWPRGGGVTMGCYDGEYWVNVQPYKRAHTRPYARTRDYGRAVEHFENALRGGEAQP